VRASPASALTSAAPGRSSGRTAAQASAARSVQGDDRVGAGSHGQQRTRGPGSAAHRRAGPAVVVADHGLLGQQRHAVGGGLDLRAPGAAELAVPAPQHLLAPRQGGVGGQGDPGPAGVPGAGGGDAGLGPPPQRRARSHLDVDGEAGRRPVPPGQGHRRRHSPHGQVGPRFDDDAQVEAVAAQRGERGADHVQAAARPAQAQRRRRAQPTSRGGPPAVSPGAATTVAAASTELGPVLQLMARASLWLPASACA
jgi:hypothetical protein